LVLGSANAVWFPIKPDYAYENDTCMAERVSMWWEAYLQSMYAPRGPGERFGAIHIGVPPHVELEMAKECAMQCCHPENSSSSSSLVPLATFNRYILVYN
jgi:hypothetical protein